MRQQLNTYQEAYVSVEADLQRTKKKLIIVVDANDKLNDQLEEVLYGSGRTTAVKVDS